MAEVVEYPRKMDAPKKDDNEWDFPEQHMGHVQERLEYLNKRIAKQGLTPFQITEVLRYLKHFRTVFDPYGESSSVEETDPKKFDDIGVRAARYIRLRVEGEEQVVAGYRFIGTIQHKGDAGNVLANAPGQKIPTGYHAASNLNCDHCHTKQARNETYILQSEQTGEYKQVGGSCLRDFLGLDPKAMLDYNTHFHALKEELEETERMRVNQFVWSNEVYMAFVSAVIRQHGWMSVSRSRELQESDSGYRPPTSGEAFYYAYEWEHITKHDGETRIVPSETDVKLAKEAKAWAAGGFEKTGELSDYERNAEVVARMQYIDHKSLGLAASIVNGYIREQEKEAAAKLAPSPVALKWVGTPGKRGEFDITVMSYRRIEMGEKNYRTPDTIALYKFQDQAGNVLTWFTNSAPADWEKYMDREQTCVVIGKRFHVKATVKEHREYKGRPETSLTRVTVLKELAVTDPTIASPEPVVDKPLPPRPKKCTCGGEMIEEGRFRHCSSGNRMHDELKCECGAWLNKGTGAFETDYLCQKCDREYDSNGSQLAPRSQWGEETGERF